MKHILIEYEVLSPTVHLTADLMSTFAKKYKCELKIMKTIEIKSSDLQWCDIVMSIRGFCTLSADISKISTEADRFHILILDDDLLAVNEKYIVSQVRLTSLRTILDYTDIILTSNYLLGEKYSVIGKASRYEIMNTVVHAADIVPPPDIEDESQKVKILYAAGQKHVEMFNRYIVAIMPQLCKEFGKSVSMTFIGVRPELSEYEKEMEIHYIDMMPFDTYRKYLQDNRFDIGLAPLNEDGFCQYKYFNKYLEYSMAGIAGIYTDCAPYTFVVKHESNGFLCKNTEEGWLNAFRCAILNSTLRRQCVYNAQMQLHEEFCSDQVTSKLAEKMPELLNYDAPHDRNIKGLWRAKLRYRNFQINDSVYLVYSYFKELGGIGTLKKIKDHFIGRKIYGSRTNSKI